MKPYRWTDCPSEVLRNLLFELEIEPDENHNKAETIEGIVDCNWIASPANTRLINSVWKFISEDEFARRVQIEVNKIEEQLNRLKRYIG